MIDAAAITTILGALGGWEAVKYFLNRRTNRRKAEAEADSTELKTLIEVNDFLQAQLKAKEERFAKQTEVVRDLQGEVFKEKDLRHAAELELVVKRCNEIPCPYRQPPTEFTQSADGLDIHQYHAQRKHKKNDSTH